MNEEELKTLVGETAFNAMSAEQKTATLGRFVKPEPEKKPPPKEEDPDLIQKAANSREKDEAASARSKLLESAVRFEMSSEKFLKDNASLLPVEVSDIFKEAGKEKYEDAIEKDAAIKAGMVQAFFKVQANVDLLTAGQKKQLDDYLSLTKTGKQEKAQTIYDMIFEPAFEMLKRVKKAEALQKGHGSGDSDDYKNRLMAGSRKHYLGEKVS